MTGSIPRLTAIVAAVSLALALTVILLAQSTASAPAAAQAKTDCGKYRSTSIYGKGQVFAIRGVKCRKARKVAKKFDHKGAAPSPWACVLGHGGRTLFSCGYGESTGNIRDWPHALIAKGVGSPSSQR